MAANRPRLRAPLWVASLLVLATAHALPAHPDVLLEPEAGSFGLRLRAVRRPDGSSHITHTSAHTTHTGVHTSDHTAHHQGVRVALPPVPDSLPAQSAPQPETKFGDRTRPVNVKGQPPVSKIGPWQAHPDVKVVLPPGLDESIVPANDNDGVRAEPDAAEDSKPENVPTNEEEKSTEEKKETPDKSGEDDGTRQKLPDTHVVLPLGWDEPGFKPAGNEDAVRGEENKEDDDTRNKKPDTFVQLPPVDGAPGLRPPGEDGVREKGDEEKKEDETKQNLPDTSVVLPPGWDEPGFRPVENNDGVRGEANKNQDDTRNKEPNTSVQLPPGYEELGDQPAGDEEGVREEENDKEDNTRQKLPDTSVVLPPGWDEPGFRPPGNEEALRDETPQDNTNTPEQTDSSPGENPNPMKGEPSSSTPSEDASPSKDSTNKDVAKETQNAPSVSSTQTVKNKQPSPSNAENSDSTNMNDKKDEKKPPEKSEDSAKPSEEDPVDKPQDALPDSAQSVKKSGSAGASPDDPVRFQVPPEFYLTRKNHAARPHVRPTPSPSDRPDFIAENPLFEWTFPCSSQEKSCLEEDRVLYDGDRKCYQLWRSGPCERGQWLVIDKVEALNGSGHFRAVCANMSRCPERQVFMASDRQCHPFAQIIREICPKHEGLQLSYNVFGEGECKCDNCPHPQLPTNTFGEGRCAFPPSFYRAGAHVGLEVAWRAAMAEAAADVAGKTAKARAAALTA